MYRLLIVDDEPIIVEGLFEFFSEVKELDLEVFKAYSGVEALDIMKRVRMDIVLSDICMPGITGLQLQSEILLQWPRCKTIFLTGFNEFDYVKAAIRNGGADYILKTEGDEAILSAVERCINKISQELEEERLLEEANLKLNSALPILKKKYVLDILEGMEDFNELGKQLKNFEIPLKEEQPILLIGGRVDSWKDGLPIKDKLKVLYQISEIVEKYISVKANILSIVYGNFNLIWVVQSLNSEEEEWQRLPVYIQGILESVQEKNKSLFDVVTSFITSGEKVSWIDAANKFSHLKYYFNELSALNKEILIMNFESQEGLNKTKGIEEREKEFYIRGELKKLASLEAYLESSQKDEYNRLFTDVVNNIKRLGNISTEMKTEIYYSFAVMFLSILNRISISEEDKEGINLHNLMQINSHNSWESAFEYFKTISECIFNKKQIEYNDNNNRIVAYIKNYIETHLEGDLSLTKLADLLHFNHSYLSRMYKQVTGISLSEYISEVKINKARELLRKDNIKVNEISIALGFETPSYFTRFFKKHTNLTPQEYRESLLR